MTDGATADLFSAAYLTDFKRKKLIDTMLSWEIECKEKRNDMPDYVLGSVLR